MAPRSRASSSSASPTVLGRQVGSPLSSGGEAAVEVELDGIVPRMDVRHQDSAASAVSEPGEISVRWAQLPSGSPQDDSEATPLVRELRAIHQKLDLLLRESERRGSWFSGLPHLPDPPLWATFAAAFLSVFSLAPLIYGFPSLRRLLLEEGELPGETAKAKELYLAIVFTVGASASQAGRLPFGLMSDRLGPRVTVLLAGLVVSAGCALMSCCSPARPYYEWAYLLMGLGGAGTQVTAMGTASLAQRRALVSVSLSMTYQAGFIILKIFYFIYRGTGLNHQQLFGALSVYAAIAAVGCGLAYPARRQRSTTPRPSLQSSDGEEQDLKTVLRSFNFWKVVFWFSTLFLSGQFFYATAALRLGPVPSEEVEPLGLDTIGVLLSPTVLVVGKLMQMFRTETLFAWVAAANGFLMALCFVPVTSGNWIRMQYALFCIIRGCFFGLCSASVGLIFGFRHYGTLLGIVFLAGGAAGALVRPLVQLTAGRADPSTLASPVGPFGPVDGTLMALCLCWALVYAVPLLLQALRGARGKHASAEAGSARFAPRKRSEDGGPERLLDRDVEDLTVFTKVITRKVKRGCIDRYRELARELAVLAESHPGFLGQTVIEPQPGGIGANTFVAVLRFQGLASMIRWDNSQTLQEFFIKVQDLTDWAARTEIPEAVGRSVYVKLPTIGEQGVFVARVWGFVLVWLLSAAATLGLDAAGEALAPSGGGLNAAWALRRTLVSLLAVAAAFGLLVLAIGPQALPKLKRE